MIILCYKTHIKLHIFDWIFLETAQQASLKLTVCGTPDCRYLLAWYLTIKQTKASVSKVSRNLRAGCYHRQSEWLSMG